MPQQDVYASLTELFTSHAMLFRNDAACIDVISSLADYQTARLTVKKPYALADAIDLILNSINPLLTDRAQFRQAGKVDMENVPVRVELLRRLDNSDMQPVLRIMFESFSTRHSQVYLPVLHAQECDAQGRPLPVSFATRFKGLSTSPDQGPSAEAICKALRRTQSNIWTSFKLERPRLMAVK